MNSTTPLSSPLFVTLLLNALVVPLTSTLPDLIQKGCPVASTLNVYVNPLTNVKVGLLPLIAPVKI